MSLNTKELIERVQDLVKDIKCEDCEKALNDLEMLLNSDATQIKLTLTISREPFGKKDHFEVHADEAVKNF